MGCGFVDGEGVTSHEPASSKDVRTVSQALTTQPALVERCDFEFLNAVRIVGEGRQHHAPAELRSRGRSARCTADDACLIRPRART